MRWLVGSIADWTALAKEAFKALKPGGYLETHEPSSGFESKGAPFDEKNALSQWGKIFVKGGVKFGRPFTVFEDDLQRKAMEEAGFVDIREMILEVRIMAGITPILFYFSLGPPFQLVKFVPFQLTPI